MQALANAQTYNLVSRVTGHRSLAKCLTLFTWASPQVHYPASIARALNGHIGQLSTGRGNAASFCHQLDCVPGHAEIGGVTLNGHDWLGRFPLIAAARAALKVRGGRL